MKRNVAQLFHAMAVPSFYFCVLQFLAFDEESPFVVIMQLKGANEAA